MSSVPESVDDAEIADDPGFAVCVYCASATDKQPYLDLARAVGTGVAQRGWRLVSGGGSVSMMGAMTAAARAAGGYTYGVIPVQLRDREVADVDSDELVVTTTMRERKRLMDEASDAFLVLPGGIGTLEEFFEMWTSQVLGFHERPVVVCDPDGFYAPLLTWLDSLRARGFVRQSAMDQLVVATNVEDALAACAPETRRARRARAEQLGETRNP